MFDALLERLTRGPPAQGPSRCLPRMKRARPPASWGIPCWCAPSLCAGRPGHGDRLRRADIREYMAIIEQATSRSTRFWWINICYGKEIEVDAICDGEDVLIPGIMEHIERAGIHSGDSISVYPAVSLAPGFSDKMIDVPPSSLAHELHVRRPDQHPVYRLCRRAVSHRGQPPLFAHCAVYQQGDGRAR